MRRVLARISNTQSHSFLPSVLSLKWMLWCIASLPPSQVLRPSADTRVHLHRKPSTWAKWFCSDCKLQMLSCSLLRVLQVPLSPCVKSSKVIFLFHSLLWEDCNFTISSSERHSTSWSIAFLSEGVVWQALQYFYLNLLSDVWYSVMWLSGFLAQLHMKYLTDCQFFHALVRPSFWGA